ncbi:MAG: type III secretion system chaperone, partial [Kiritimatiellae bacterium]|nr:type III secretion system chaperone [Kiritimatiellia bacterium]
TYGLFLRQVRKTTGIQALVPDESGLATVRVDDAYNLNFQFAGATGKILCFVEVAELPLDAPASVYRDLLAAGLFGKDTAGGYFALEPETGIVVYNYAFDLEPAAKDIPAFVSTLEKILQLADFWSTRIKTGTTPAPSSAPPPDDSSSALPHHYIRP